MPDREIQRSSHKSSVDHLRQRKWPPPPPCLGLKPQTPSCCGKSPGTPEDHVGAETMSRRQIRTQPIRAHLGLDRACLHHRRHHHRTPTPYNGSWLPSSAPPPPETAVVDATATASRTPSRGRLPPRHWDFARRRLWQRRWEGERAFPPCVVLVINDNPYGLMFASSYICRTCP
jgi:hypothetical protein